MNFVTDRTASDVMLNTSKGNYSITDLNRVESAVGELQALAMQLDIYPGLVVKADWALPGEFTSAAWPTEGQMRRYLQNVIDLCDAVAVHRANLPQTLACLTWQGANAIEEALQAVYLRIRCVIENYQYSGELIAGEEIIL